MNQIMNPTYQYIPSPINHSGQSAESSSAENERPMHEATNTAGWPYAAFDLEQDKPARAPLTAYDSSTKMRYAYNANTGIWKPLNNLGQRADSDIDVDFNELDNFHSNHMIHVANGVLNIAQNGQLRLIPPSPYLFSRNRSPIEWDPKASADVFLSTLQRVLSPDDVLALQLYFGQCLLGKNHTHTMLLLHDRKNIMKTTVLHILMHLLGNDSFETLRTSHLDGRLGLERYVGKQLIVAQNVHPNFLATNSASTLNRLMGGDWLGAQLSESNTEQSTTVNFNACVTANSFLIVQNEGDRATLKRRLLVLMFKSGKNCKKVTRDFTSKIILKEGPGILRWAVDGAVTLLREISKTGSFPRSEDQITLVKRMVNFSDCFSAFVSTHIQYDPHSHVTHNELFIAFHAFLECHIDNKMSDWLSNIDETFPRMLPTFMKSREWKILMKNTQYCGNNEWAYQNVRLLPQIQMQSGASKEVTN